MRGVYWIRDWGKEVHYDFREIESVEKMPQSNYYKEYAVYKTEDL